MTPPSSRRFLLLCALGAALGLAGCQQKPPAAAPPAARAAADGGMSMGDPAAKVHVEEYASFTCSHCAEFNNTVFPAFKAKYIDTGKVRYTLHEFATTDRRDVAAAGFMTARCAGPDKYFAAIDDFFHRQAKMYETKDVMGTLRAATGVGMSERSYRTCLSDKAASPRPPPARRRRSTPASRATPTFLFNGKKVKEGEDDRGAGRRLRGGREMSATRRAARRPPSPPS